MNLKRKLILPIAAAVIVCFAGAAYAADMTWKYDEQTAVVSVKGYGMINDGEPLKAYLSTAKKIEVLKGVSAIERNVFADCGIVEEVVLPDGFEKLGSNSFSLSKSLKTINFPDTMTEIGDEAFFGCVALENVEISKNIKTIGANAFAGCVSLKGFAVSEENPYFTAVDGVLYTKDKKTLVAYPAGRGEESFKVPEGTEKIGVKAFAYDRNLRSVELPESLTEICDRAFYFCELLKDVSFGGGLKSIGEYAFFITAVRNVEIPYGTEKLGSGAFKNCENLKTAGVPGTVTEIGAEVFRGASDSFVLEGFGTAAKQYADETGVPFKEAVRVIVNGKPIVTDKCAEVKDGCTMVPMRSIFEALGAEVSWNDETETATGERDGKKCSFKIGDDKLYINGEEKTLLAPAVLENGRTLVHVRAIAEALGADVLWNGETGLVTITD